jgi:NDP-sugar pyrophosphorylase family protein
MHAGVSPTVLSLGKTIAGINSTIRPWYAKTDSADVPANVIPFIDNESPFWYRGYFLPPLATQGLVDSTVDFYNVKKIIVGHTIHDNIAYYYDGKVIGIDTDWHHENAQGLLLEENQFYRVDIYGKKKAL